MSFSKQLLKGKLIKLLKIWKSIIFQIAFDHPTCLLRNLYAGQEATVKLDMKQQTGSK